MPPTTGSDAAGEWTITGTGDGIAWSHEHGKGDAALRGSAKDLLLAIVRRQTGGRRRPRGVRRHRVWDGWLDRTPF